MVCRNEAVLASHLPVLRSNLKGGNAHHQKCERPRMFWRGLDPALIPVLVELAERHVGFNVKAEHYGSVGLAIVMTLGKTLGPVFHEQTKAAWVELWSLICSVMIPAHVQRAQEMRVEM